MSQLNTTFFVFILGIVVGILGTTIFTLAYSPVYAESTSGESSGLIAVTGLCAQGISGLWVIDARDAKSSPSLCLYMPDGAGQRGFKLTGARRIKYDLQLLEYNDQSARDMRAGDLQRTVEERNRKAEEAAKKNSPQK